MKFFYIGRFDRPYATENYVTWALRSLGHEVVKRPYTRTSTADTLLRQARKAAPDVVLFSKASSPCFVPLLTKLRQDGILTVTWLWDLYFGYRRARPVQMHADLVFSTDGGHPHCWEEMGVDHRVLRQGIHEPEHVIYQATDADKYDLAFVGSPASYSARAKLTTWLRQTYGSQLRTFSSGLRGLALNQELARARVVIGDSYPAAAYWSNRVYEILGRGGFLLHPVTPGLEIEFVDGEHYVGYQRDDYPALKNLIDSWLADSVGRERIRRAGFERVGQFTYTSRCRSLVEQIETELEHRHLAKFGDLRLLPGEGNPSAASWNHDGQLQTPDLDPQPLAVDGQPAASWDYD